MLRTLLTLFLLLCHLVRSNAQEIDSTLWGANGEVHAIARKGNTIYLGGSFTHVGPVTGGGAVLNAATGRLVAADPPVIHGIVRVAIADGAGGWYIGGLFEAVAGTSCTNLAHLNADGTLDRNWNVIVTADIAPYAFVSSLALAGDLLYVGGGFTRVGGADRKNLAAVHVRTGQVAAWDPRPDDYINALAVTGRALFVGGSFRTISEQSKKRLAAFDLASGGLLPWNLDVGYYWGADLSSRVNTMVVSGTTVYVGGVFSSIGGLLRSYVAAVSGADGSVSTWQVPEAASFPFNYNPSIRTMALSGNTLYVGGNFRYTGNEGTNYKDLAAFDTNTGAIRSWAPQLSLAEGEFGSGVVHALQVHGNRVLVGGAFGRVNGQPRNHLAYLDLLTGTLQPQSAGPSKPVTSLCVAGDVLFAGGGFSSIGGIARNNLAAINAVTGRATEWNPEVNGRVKAVLIKDDLLYAGGTFTQVSGSPKHSLAAISLVTGKATAWEPRLGRVNALARYGDTLYVGAGNEEGLLSFDTSSEQPLARNTQFTAQVNALGIAGDTLYVAQNYAVSGYALKTNTLTGWRIFRTNYGQISDVKVIGDKVLVAGVGGAHAYAKAAGAAKLWDVAATYGGGPGTVNTIALVGDTAYLAGYMGDVNGTRYVGIVKVNHKNGALSPLRSPWEQTTNADLEFFSSLVFGEIVYLGGRVGDIGRTPVGNFTSFGGKPLLSPVHWVTGRVYHDANENCQAGDGEAGLAGLLVKAEPGPYYALTDNLGRYALALNTGSYRIEPVLSAERGKLIRQTCPEGPAPREVRLETATDTVSSTDFGNHLTQTPYLTASVGSTRRRRCMASNTLITYCNEGFLAAGGVKVHLALPEHVLLVSADVPYTRDPDHHYVFTIGTLAAGACGVITVRDSVVCNNPDIRGLTQCTKVWITPANAAPPGPGWDGADVALRGMCLSNGRVKMGLYNAGTGDMTDSTAYRVYLDALLVFSRRFKLAAGDSLLLQVPANGQTVRLEADQRPGHPTRLQTSMTLEACGTNAQGKVSLGFVAQLPCNDAEPEVAIECLPITDSYDPNDKLVRPAGIAAEHYTALGQVLEYTVRFQNTGNDYAYKVVVTDTLTDQFDVSTLRVTGASHPYQFNVSGKGRPLLTWTFNDINLPDSTRDPAGSNGFVKFTVKPLAALPPGTRIENHADIFFDFNPPIRTNTVWNTLYEAPLAVAGGWGVPVVVCAKVRPAIDWVGSDSLRCSLPGDRYQWFLDEKELPYTTRVIRATQSGDYRVSIMQPDCYPLRSDPLSFVVTGLGRSLNAAVTIHPNPTPGRFAFHLPAGAGPASVTAWDATGRRVLSLTVLGKASGPVQAEMDLTAHPNGIYILKIETARAVVVRRVAKQ